MKIKEARGNIILNSRKEKTIEISLKTSEGLFIASSPSGKSKGKYEEKYYIGSIENDIKTLSNFADKFSGLRIGSFIDLKKLKKLLGGKLVPILYFP